MGTDSDIKVELKNFSEASLPFLDVEIGNYGKHNPIWRYQISYVGDSPLRYHKHCHTEPMIETQVEAQGVRPS